jgi:hypothetical protein
MADVLIVYSLVQSPPVASVRDALYSFERHSGHRCWYLNLGVRRVPRWLARMRFDAVIFDTTLLWDRVNPATFARHRRKLRRLAGSPARRVALPQDEHRCSRALGEFVRELRVDHVFSVAPPTEWPALYPDVDTASVGFSQVLTGYLEQRTLERIDAIVRAQASPRPIAIGYRAASASPSLGRHGRLKVELGKRVAAAAAARGLPVDIATGGAATIRGDDWYRFLARCRWTIGVEGGASLHDPDGSLFAASARFLAAHPDASFEEVEASCFPGRDGDLRYVAISPRHLEAAATRTAQILVEGDYNGILRAGEHYLELRRDLGNLHEVLDLVARDAERERLVENAHRDIVRSGAYTYSRFVDEVLAIALAAARPAPAGAGVRALHRVAQALDRLSWRKVALYVRVAGGLRRAALRWLPEPALALLRRAVAGSPAETAALQGTD